ncbi:hypothetical protein CerSpe_240060 [Prunus speciosa]
MQELCMFCGDTTESALHVLVMCPFAAATWDISLLTRHAHQVRCNTMNDWLREMLGSTNKAQRDHIITLLWAIWGNRNTLLWQGVQRSPHDVVAFAQQYVHEFITVNGTSSKVTNWVRDAVRWAAPPSGRLKINFDGAFDPTSGRGAVGAVARDAEGGFVAAMV